MNFNLNNTDNTICNECECTYTFENNNQYGYENCCFSCGENKYTDYLDQKKKKINFNDLPGDIKSMIYAINKNRDKEDLYKLWGEENCI